MDGLGYLRRAQQNYIQYNVESRFHVTKPTKSEENREVDVVLFKGWYDDIWMSTREEFNKKYDMSGSDYRINESNILFELHDPEVANRIYNCVVLGFLCEERYDITLEKVINILEKKNELILK